VQPIVKGRRQAGKIGKKEIPGVLDGVGQAVRIAAARGLAYRLDVADGLAGAERDRIAIQYDRGRIRKRRANLGDGLAKAVTRLFSSPIAPEQVGSAFPADRVIGYAREKGEQRLGLATTKADGLCERRFSESEQH